MGVGDLFGVKVEYVVVLMFLCLVLFIELCGDEIRYEFLSEMILMVFLVFFGFMVGCVKCYDYKYDGILTRDFYRMKVFFLMV